MYVQIVKVESPNSWYVDKVGSVFQVHESVDGYYEVVDMDMYFISVDDCKIVKEVSLSAGDPSYLTLLDKMRELHIAKNAGYSGDSPDRWANFRMAEGFGVSAFLGVLVRMSDKFIRIQNLVKNPDNEKVGESIKDTLMDLASYALIAICILNEKE